MGALVHSFWNDERVQVAFLLVVLDLFLGVIAAVKMGTFRLSFVSDVLRNDVLFKVLPFFALYAGYKYAGNADIVIPGLDLEVVMNAAWVVVLAALVGSLVNSLRDLNIPIIKSLSDTVAGPDPVTPVVPSDKTDS